jgi:hypothetical protein
MKQILQLTFGLLLLNSISNAQVNNGIIGDNTAFIFNFNGSSGNNCSTRNGVPRFDYLPAEYPSYMNYGFTGTALMINKTAQTKNYSNFPISFHDDFCNVVTMDFSGGVDIKIKVNSTVAVPECMVMLGDANNKWTSAAPQKTSLVVGDNELTLSGVTWQEFGGATVDPTNIVNASLYFRNGWNDMSTGNQIVGDFTIDYISFNGSNVTNTVTSKPSSNDINVYPNPATEVINIDAKDQDVSNVRITSTIGNVVHNQNIATGTKKLSINTNSYSAGVYFIEVTTGSEKITKKLIIN